MAEVDFSDLESTEAWFEIKSPEIRCAIAGRVAIRTITQLIDTDQVPSSHEILVCLRCILVSMTKASNRPKALGWEAVSYAAAFSETRLSLKRNQLSPHASSIDACRAAARSATNGGSLAAAEALENAFRVVRARDHFGVLEFIDEIRADDSVGLAVLLNTSIWRDGPFSQGLLQQQHLLVRELSSEPHWHFWHRFYDGMWNGTFDEWDLAFEVIQIDEEIWEEGVEAVAAEIEQLARDRAKRSLDTLQLPLQNRHGIGGNNPPPDQELEAAAAQIVEGATFIRAQSDAPNPDKTLIERGLSLMGNGLLAIIKWIGRKGDLTVDQLIKWGVPAGCAYLVANPAKIQAAIDAANTWLALL